MVSFFALLSMTSLAAEPFTDPAAYRDTFFVAVNGNCNLAGPMIGEMIGGGEAVIGGGDYAKVACSTGMYYGRMTAGASNDYQFHVLHSPENHTRILHPERHRP